MKKQLDSQDKANDKRIHGIPKSNSTVSASEEQRAQLAAKDMYAPGTEKEQRDKV